MGKLHELLAVEKLLLKKKNEDFEKTKHALSKEIKTFQGFSQKLELFDKERKLEETFSSIELTSTVKDELNSIEQSFCDYWDIKYNQEVANQNAIADVILDDGTKILEKVPVKFLLTMEDELDKLRSLYNVIPTLQKGIRWEDDPVRGNNIKRMENPIIKPKTEKSLRTQTIFKPTETQPGQYEKWFVDIPIGNYTEEYWSGALSPNEKTILLNKLDMLIMAFHKARQRANAIEMQEKKVGKLLFKLLND